MNYCKLAAISRRWGASAGSAALLMWALAAEPPVAVGDDSPSRGLRQALERIGPAVVVVTAVVRIEASTLPGGSQERSVETFGTVVGSGGLTAVSATSLSPFNNIGDSVEIGGVRPAATATRIRVRWPDGAETPARQVLTDEEMDLTFLAPEPEDGKSLPAVPAPLEFEREAAPDAGEDILTVGRAGQMFNWAPVIGRAQVLARIESPRRLYLVAGPYLGGVGTPLLTLDGKAFAFTVLRREPTMPRAGEPPFRQAMVGLPAEDLTDLIQQAARAAQNARKPAAP